MFEQYIGQPLKTRDGGEAIVLGVLEDKVNGKTLFGAFMTDENGWCPTTWHLDGRWLTNDPFAHDLMPPKRMVWMVWPRKAEFPLFFDDHKLAIEFASNHDVQVGEYEEP